MKTDIEICHVTNPEANLFLELGFSPAEAKRLHAASRKQIKVELPCASIPTDLPTSDNTRSQKKSS